MAAAAAGLFHARAATLEPFTSMVWRDDGVIAGLGHGAAYAIDSQTRTLEWAYTGLGTSVALSPDGTSSAFDDGGLKFLDARTGTLSAEPPHPGGGDLRFSPDGAWLLDVCHKDNTGKLPEYLEDYLFKNLQTAVKIRSCEFIAELAVHALLGGAPEIAMRYADAIEIGSDVQSCESLGHLAAHFAKADHPDYAAKCLERANAGFELDDWTGKRKPVLSAYFAVTQALLGVPSEYSELLQGDTCYPTPPDSQPGAYLDIDPQLVKPVALYRAWTDDIEGAAAAVHACHSNLWWFQLAAIAHAVLAHRDLDRLELFLRTIVARKHTDHDELLTHTIELCLELDPARALGFLQYVPTLSVAAAEQRIRAHPAQTEFVVSSEPLDFDALLEAAGKDPSSLESVLKKLVERADFDRANAVRAKIPKAQRAVPTRHLLRTLLKAGEYSTALLLLEELEPNEFQRGGREYEILVTLLREVWKTDPRIAEVY